MSCLVFRCSSVTLAILSQDVYNDTGRAAVTLDMRRSEFTAETLAFLNATHLLLSSSVPPVFDVSTFVDPINRTMGVYNLHPTWYSAGRSLVRGGQTVTFSLPFQLMTDPIVKAYATPTTCPLSNASVVIVSNGVCASTCAQFLSTARYLVRDLARVSGYSTKLKPVRPIGRT